MQQLTENILDVTTLEAGKFHLRLKIEEPVDLIQESLEMLRPMAEEKLIQLRSESERSGALIECDRERILQVLSNLVGNAIKFTPNQGLIRVSTQDTPDEVIFSVSDSGPGVSTQHSRYIFDRFWQATKENKSGIGLGLSICKGILDAHQGRIWVDHEATKGAIFHFALRRASRPVPAPDLTLLPES